MCFHHLDGFFNIAIFVSLKNSQMFLIDPSLDHGFTAVLVGKNRNPASEPFGGLCKSGVVAVTVKNEMEFSRNTGSRFAHQRLWQLHIPFPESL